LKLKIPIGIDIAYNNATTKYNPATGKDEEFPPDWSVPITPMPDFVICKASQGNIIEDFTFASNWKQLGERGIPRGAYHYYDYRYGSSGSQAKYFVSVINKAGGIKSGDVLVLDEEQEGFLSATAIVDFLYNVELLTGIRPVIYSRTLLLNGLNLVKLTATQKEYLKSTPTWIAGTFNDKDAVDGYSSPPSMFIPDQSRFGPVVMWQYGLDVDPKGLMSGLPGGLDFNWIDPTFYADWKSKTTGTGVPEVPPTEPEGDAMKGTVLVNLNVRPAPSTNPVYMTLFPGDKVETESPIEAGWWKLSKITRNGVVKPLPAPVCYAYQGENNGYIRIDDVVVPPPPPTEVTLKHTIKVYSDGKIDIDGIPYP